MISLFVKNLPRLVIRFTGLGSPLLLGAETD